MPGLQWLQERLVRPGFPHKLPLLVGAWAEVTRHEEDEVERLPGRVARRYQRFVLGVVCALGAEDSPRQRRRWSLLLLLLSMEKS